MKRTAVREVREETGVWARISTLLQRSSYVVSGEPVEVQFYLMEAKEEGKPSDHLRKHVWKPLDVALRRASHDETRRLLSLADEQRTKIDAIAKGHSEPV